MAHQEGVLCEEVMLVSESQEDVCVGVKVHARVMGKTTEASYIITLEEHDALLLIFK